MAAPLIFVAALRHCFFTAMIVLLDLGRVVAFGLRSRRALAAENLSLRKPTSAVSGTEAQTTQGRSCNPLDDGNVEPDVCLARCSVERETGYADPLAPKGIAPVLAMEPTIDEKGDVNFNSILQSLESSLTKAWGEFANLLRI